jgi:hypothetical protein
MLPALFQVFLHWTHCLVDKASQEPSRQNGISLFVFDHDAKIVQLLHFSEPMESARPQLYHEVHLVPLHS